MSAILPVSPQPPSRPGPAAGSKLRLALACGLLPAVAAGIGSCLLQAVPAHVLLTCLITAAAGGGAAWWAMGALLSSRQAALARAQGEAGAAPAGGDEPPSGELLSLLYEHSPLGLTLRGFDGTFIRGNPAFLRLVGYTAEELRALPRRVLTPPEHFGTRAQARLNLQERGAFGPYDSELLNRDGVRVPVRLSGVRTTDRNGQALYWSIVEDITERRRMMEALKHSESEGRMLAAVASNTNNMVLICDREGRIEWVNQAFESITGYTRREAVGQRPGTLLQGPDTDPETVAHMRAGIASKEAFDAEVLNYTSDGRAYWVALECAPVFDHAGELERYVAIERDITETRSMHLALAQSEERFRDLTELSTDWFWERDKDLRVVHITDFSDGMSRSRLRLGTQPWDSGNSLLPPEVWARHREVLEAHLPFTDFENAIRLEDGRITWRSTSGKPIFDADGNFKGYRGAGRDITARKEAEELLKESKRMYRRVVESVRDIIFQTNELGQFVFLNHAWSVSTGFGVESAIGEPIFDFVHPDDRGAARRMVAEVSAGVGKYVGGVGRMRTSDGSYRWFEAEVKSHIEPDGGMVIAGTLHDVTRERAAQAERRAAEAALREVEGRYSRALAGANDGAWEFDLKAQTFFTSERLEELLGFVPGQGPQTNLEFRDGVHPEDLSLHLRNIGKLASAGGPRNWDLRLRCGDGVYRWFRMRGMATLADDGQPTLTSGTLTDIDQAKRAEQELKRHRDDLAGLVEERTASAESARAEAEKAQRAAEAANRSKSEFLANMSHELRTPMHAILSFASFGVDKVARAEREKLSHYFSNIQKSGARLLSLLNDLLDLSKLEAGKMEMHLSTVDPAGLVRDAMVEAEALAKSREVQLVLEAPERPLSAQLDGPRIVQVIANLLSNAIKFSPKGGQVLVSLLSRPGAQAADGIEIRVRDEGVGIPEAELEAVFDKFVQSSKTKTGAGGTGLGLAICREIVHAHRGTIVAVNNPAPAAGSCFSIFIPAPPEPA